MKLLHTILAGPTCTVILLLLLGCPWAQASPTDERATSTNVPRTAAEAQRTLELAELRLRRFDRVDYQLAMRRLEHEIKLAQAEIDSYERRIDEYERFTRNRYSSPLLFTLEEIRLALLEAELRLKRLREEKCLRIQYKGQDRRIHVLEVEQARDWLGRFGDAEEQ